MVVTQVVCPKRNQRLYFEKRPEPHGAHLMGHLWGALHVALMGRASWGTSDKKKKIMIMRMILIMIMIMLEILISADPSLVERARSAPHVSICIHGDRLNSYDPTSLELI